MTTFIQCSDSFIQDLVLATVESYHYGTGERPSGHHPSREVYGYIWGYQNDLEDDDDGRFRFVRFERLQISLSSQRKAGEVSPNAEALESSINVMNRLSPHMHLLADFHTHPYPDHSASEITTNKLYEFSPEDEKSFVQDDLLWSQAGDQPLMTVATICEMKRTRSSEGAVSLRENVLSFDLGQFRIWFNVRGGYLDDAGERAETTDIHLDLERRLGNIAGLPVV